MRRGDSSPTEAPDVREEVVNGAAPPADLRVIQTDDAVQVVGHLDRRRAEALALEVRAVARRYGLEVQSARMLPDEVPDAEPSSGRSDSTQ